MSWQTFALIQTAIFAIAAVGGLSLLNRRLCRQNDELTRLCLAAHDELVNISGKLSEMESLAPPETLLAERLKGLTGDDTATQVRRLVLEHELSPGEDLEERLAGHLAEPREQEFVQRWKSIRAECQQLAMFLIADDVPTEQAIGQLFKVVEPLDVLYDVQLQPLTPSETRASDAPEPPDERSEELDQAALDELLASTQAAAEGPPEGVADRSASDTAS